MWERDEPKERIRIEAVRDANGRRTARVLLLDGTPAYFAASDLPPGVFLADSEWIVKRYRLVT